jgi:hypothetical protein
MKRYALLIAIVVFACFTGKAAAASASTYYWCPPHPLNDAPRSYVANGST